MARALETAIREVRRREETCRDTGRTGWETAWLGFPAFPRTDRAAHATAVLETTKQAERRRSWSRERGKKGGRFEKNRRKKNKAVWVGMEEDLGGSGRLVLVGAFCWGMLSLQVGLEERKKNTGERWDCKKNYKKNMIKLHSFWKVPCICVEAWVVLLTLRSTGLEVTGWSRQQKRDCQSRLKSWCLVSVDFDILTAGFEVLWWSVCKQS